MNYLQSLKRSSSFLSFKEFIKKYTLRNAPTSNIKLNNILKQLNLDCKIYMRDTPIKSNCGIINLHPFRGTHWVCFFNNFYFDSYGCPPPQNILQLHKIKL